MTDLTGNPVHNGNLIRLHEEKMEKLEHRLEKMGDIVFRHIGETKEDIVCRLDEVKEDTVSRINATDKRVENVEKNLGRIPWILIGLIVNIGLTILAMMMKR